MKKYLFIPLAIWCGIANASDNLSTAIQNVHEKCITDFGKDIENFHDKLDSQQSTNSAVYAMSIGIYLFQLFPKLIQKIEETNYNPYRGKDDGLEDELNVTFKNLRTVGTAGITITHTSGAIQSARTRIDKHLKNLINNCKTAVNDLSRSRTQAHISGTPAADIKRAEQIIKNCENIGTVNINLINKKSTSATITNGIGATIGLAGTITSALANTKKVRESDDEKKEKQLNIATNALIIASNASAFIANNFTKAQIKEISKLEDNMVSCLEAFENKTTE